jgi:hypothetical protein
MVLDGYHPFRRFAGWIYAWPPRRPPSRKHCLGAYVSITIGELEAYVLAGGAGG